MKTYQQTITYHNDQLGAYNRNFVRVTRSWFWFKVLRENWWDNCKYFAYNFRIFFNFFFFYFQLFNWYHQSIRKNLWGDNFIQLNWPTGHPKSWKYCCFGNTVGIKCVLNTNFHSLYEISIVKTKQVWILNEPPGYLLTYKQKQFSTDLLCLKAKNNINSLCSVYQWF